MLDSWIIFMRSSNRAVRTIDERVGLVRRVSRECEVEPESLTYEQVANFMAKTSSGARPTYFGHLHAWFTYLVKMGVRDDVPTLKLDRPKAHRKEPRTIGRDHLGALLVTPGQWSRTKTMLLLGAYAGMRASEIAAARVEDFDLIGGEISIHGKGDVTRPVPMHPLVRAEAERYRAMRKRGWWFPSYRHSGQHVLPASVSDTVSNLMERAGVPGTCHDLRRWYATTMVEEGHSLTTVQRLLGHSSVATTQRYVVVGMRLRIDAVLSLPDMTAGIGEVA